MVRTTLRIHVDDRGASRALFDLWLPNLDPDVVWVVDPGAELPERCAVPLVALSPTDAAAVATESLETPRRALAVFESLDDLESAAMFGLPPGRVVINHLVPEGETTRVASEVLLTDAAFEAAARLEARGFSFDIQPLPNVTARPWSPSATLDNAAESGGVS